jgi:hypothetical protein
MVAPEAIFSNTALKDEAGPFDLRPLGGRMRRVGRSALIRLNVAFGLGLLLGAAPAAPSYHGVERAIQQIRDDWARPGAPTQPNAPGWNALFDVMTGDLRAYSAATTETSRLIPLDRLYRVSVALGAVSWAPAAGLREELREWLRPRVRLAWAERQLVQTLRTMPGASDPSVQANHEKWRHFVDDDLGRSLQRYDSAATVAQRQAALHQVYGALNALQARNQAFAWDPSLELQAALNDLYNRPNLDVSADLNTVSPAFNVNLVTSGPVFRKGYWSQVTAGPKTGFGLLSSDNGIAFSNSQALTSVTPIHDFQQQIARDSQGQRVAKLYQFGATSSDQQELTIVTKITTNGLELYPSFKHSVGLNVSSDPQRGGGVGRAVATLVGFGQPKITKKVWEGAYPKMQENVVQEAAEMGWEKTSAEAALRNVTLRQYLIGNNRLAFRNLLIEALSLRSRPENVLVSGTLKYLNAAEQVGADAPQPAAFARPDPGVSADLHLSSIMTNFTRGFLQSPESQKVENLMIVTQKVPPDAPPAQGVKVAQNADYPTFLKAVEAAQAANDPKVLAIRVKRPGRSPEFGADEQGHLVALVHDFLIEVPAPKQAAAGGALAGPPARVYRFTAPEAEFVISFKVESQTQTQPLRLTGRIEGFDAGPGALVYAVNEDESQAQPLSPFTSRIILGVFGGRLRGQPIDIPLSNLQLRGFAIRSLSPLEPSGWIRVNLDRTTPSPDAGIQ